MHGITAADLKAIPNPDPDSEHAPLFAFKKPLNYRQNFSEWKTQNFKTCPNKKNRIVFYLR